MNSRTITGTKTHPAIAHCWLYEWHGRIPTSCTVRVSHSHGMILMTMSAYSFGSEQSRPVTCVCWRGTCGIVHHGTNEFLLPSPINSTRPLTRQAVLSGNATGDDRSAGWKDWMIAWRPHWLRAILHSLLTT